MNIYGKEIDFKISRLSDAGAMELAIQKMEKTEKQLIKTKGPLSVVLKGQIDMLSQFFIDATGEDVLEDCEDLEEAKAAYGAFLKAVSEQKNNIIKFSVSDIK